MNTTKKLQRMISATLILGIAFSIGMSTANAQTQASGIGCVIGAGSVVGKAAGSALFVPVGDILNNPNQSSLCIKGTVLDGLAWMVAGQILASVTDNVVDWINSGFDGSPAFLTDPETYFANQADQITGAFIAVNGPLQALCSPFRLDVTLSLATQQTSQYRNTYSCTLSSILKKGLNGSGASLNIQSSANGATLNDMLNGNILSNSRQLNVNGRSADDVAAYYDRTFQKGDWLAFTELTTRPLNNAIGAKLMANSDLTRKILSKNQQTNTDLNRGNGFLSWKKCSDAPSNSADIVSAEEMGQKPPKSNSSVSNASDIVAAEEMGQKPPKPVKDQVCHTDTPGSVVNGQLEKVLGASIDRLNAANEFNRIAEALFQQLVKTVIKQGLSTSSQIPTNQTQSAITQLYKQSIDQSNSDISSIGKQMMDTADSYIYPAIDQKYYRDQALAVLQNEQSFISGAMTDCTGGNQDGYDGLSSLLDGEVAPAVNQAQSLDNSAGSVLNALAELESKIQNATSASDIQSAGSKLTSLVSGGTLPSLQNVTEAFNSIGEAQATAGTWHTKALQYQALCTGRAAASTQM